MKRDDGTPVQVGDTVEVRSGTVSIAAALDMAKRHAARRTIPNSPWLQTIHPTQALRRFDLVNPTAAMVHFPTMALVLARIPRFGGHTEGGTYSVAQHSVEGAMAVLEAHGSDAAAAFLLHDGHEYVMGDIATPVAKALAWYADLNGGKGEVVTRSIAGLKTRLDSVIYEAAGIAWPLPEAVRAVVKQYDARMGRTEQLARMGTRSEAWSTGYEHAIPVSGVDTGYWSAEEAEAKFMLALGLFGLL